MKQFENSKRAFAEASEYMPGGVNSPVRAFKNVGGDPLFIERGKGATSKTLTTMCSSITCYRGDR